MHFCSKFGNSNFNCGELWHEQAQNGVNFELGVQFDLKSQRQLSPQTMGTVIKVFCIFGPSLLILAGTGDELPRGQTW